MDADSQSRLAKPPVVFGWRPANGRDDLSELHRSIEHLVECYAKGIKQNNRNRNRDDRRIGLLEELLKAFLLHGRPEAEFAFANLALPDEFHNKDVWASANKVYPQLVKALHLSQASGALATFVRYKGSNKNDLVMWQPWVRVREPGTWDEMPFVLEGPVLSSLDWATSAVPNSETASPPEDPIAVEAPPPPAPLSHTAPSTPPPEPPPPSPISDPRKFEQSPPAVRNPMSAEQLSTLIARQIHREGLAETALPWAGLVIYQALGILLAVCAVAFAGKTVVDYGIGAISLLLANIFGSSPIRF
jgi:hypothetical protein